MDNNCNNEKTENACIEVRPAEPADFEEILRLNEESVHFLSPRSR